jgi:hypothetical protein
MRPVPDFVVVGAAKAGTTSLHAYLEQHPQICVTRPKETFYFAWPELATCEGVGRGYGGGIRFRDADAYGALFKDTRPEVVRGEVCVAYLYFPEASQRIFETNPDCKIIVVLRHPVDRAFSNYLHHVADGLEKLSFTKAIDEIPERLSRSWWWGFDYIGASLYADQVKRYVDRFGRENTHVFLFEEMPGREVEFVAEILSTLDLPAISAMDTKPRRPGRPPVRSVWARILDRLGGRAIADAMPTSERRYRKQLTPSLRADLFEKYFAKDVEDLESVLARPLVAWR